MKKLYFEGSNPTVDLVILNHENKILLIQRVETAEACPSMWALPGGFVNSMDQPKGTLMKKFIEGAETPKEAAIREVKEETNLHLGNVNILPVGVYEGNHRDPRDTEQSWSTSHAFFYKIDEAVFEDQKNHIRGMDDAKNVKWCTIEEIKSMTLAFDHNKIISDSLALYVYKASTSLKF